MTLFLTVFVGVLVFVIGQSIQRFVLEPIQEQRKVIGEIAGAQLFLANVAHAAAHGSDIQYPETPIEAQRRLRALAARLRASLWAIPTYGLWAALRFIPKRAVVLEASTQLVGWSNSLFHGAPGIPRKRVAELLKLPSADL